MKNKKLVRMFSIVIALLMVISAITVASTVLTAEETIENDEEINESGGEMDIEELFGDKKIDEREFPIERIDALDPELNEILSGSKFSDENIDSNELSSDFDLMTDQHTYDQHEVNAVHDMGITGENTVVSLMDTGFDMAHPDLIGTQAVFEYDDTVMDPEMEMYDGYPIAFDPVSMADYAYYGEISNDYEAAPDTPDNSWYVNTSYETTAYEDGGVVYANFTLKEDNITYEMPGTVADGNDVRFGFHPDEKLHEFYGERPAVLLTRDSGGEWGDVYTDLDNDLSFADEKSAYIDDTDPESEVMTQDIDSDGIADISGGMVYFVASEHDGASMPIPYAQNYRETINKIVNLYLGYPPGTIESLAGVDGWEFITGQSEFYDTPEPGDMVALMGDFNSFGSYGAHGTWTASAVSGQAVTGVPDEDMLTGEPSPFPPTPSGGDGLPRGIAPNANIIPMGRFFDGLPQDHPMSWMSPTYIPVTYSSVFFTAEGYTGDVSITSDSADIASSSFGNTVGENHGGFNFYERLFDYVGTQYTQNTLYINSQGNEGSGFGTVGAPSGAQGVLSVGATGNQLYRVDGWNMYDGGPNPWYGDVTGMTSTGPHAKGSHGPDIMTNGQFGYSADPVNQKAQDGYFQGNNSWTLWSGTSLSAPNAAGIAALVFEAYVDAHGEAPDSATLKNIMMQGATDINNTPNLQGPGDANAYNSVRTAQGQGLYSQEFQWRPGTNPEMDQHVEHHVNMMEPGESQTDTLNLENWNTTDTIDYEMSAYREEFTSSTQVQLDSGTSGPNDDGRVPLVMINETGIYELVYNETNYNWDLGEDPMAVLDDPDAELLRFGTHVPYEEQGDYDYSLVEFYNWQDVDGNDSFDGFEERNRIGSTVPNMRIFNTFYGDEVPTSDYFTIHDALERAEDGIVVQMNNVYHGYMFSGSFELTLNIEQYNHVEWDWIEFEGPISDTIDPGDTLEYGITANVPAEAPKGIYSGKLMIENTNNGRTIPVPITITVGESTNLDEPYVFGEGDGDSAHDQGLYRNDRLYGSWTGGLTGDWRFYTVNLEEDIVDRDIKLELTFDDELSDMTAFLLGGAEHDMLGLGDPYDVDPFSVVDPLDPTWDYQDRYGLNTLETHNETDIDVGDHVAFVRDEPMEAGTYMIAVQSHQISGHKPYQNFTGELSATNVRTGNATIISSEKALLHGELLNVPEGYDEVNASFRYRIAGDDVWEETTPMVLDEPGDFEYTLEGLTPDTTYEFRAVIQYNGNEETGVINTFTPMNVPPEVHLYPDEGDVVQGDSLVISAELDEDHPVDEFEYVEITIMEDWFDPQEAEIDGGYAWLEIPFVLSEGEHSYEIYMEDVEGNFDTIEVNFEVDNTSPMLQIITPTNGVEELTYEEDFFIEGIAEPNATVWVNGELVDVDEEGNFNYSATLVDGQNVFHVMAEDEAGNTAETEVYALYLPDIPELWTEVNNLWDEVDNIYNETDDLQTQIDNLQTDLDAAITDLQTQIDDLHDDLMTNVSDLQTQIDDLQAELDAAVADLQDQIDNLQDDLTAAEQEISDLQTDLTAAEQEISDLDTDLSAAEQRISDLEDDLTAAEQEISDLQTDLTAAEQDISDLESDLAALRSDYEDYEEEQEEVDSSQDDDLSMASNLGIVGLVLAILALIVAIVAISKRSDESRTTKETYEREDETIETEESFEDFDEDEDF